MAYFIRPDFSMHFTVVDGILPRDTLFLHGNLAANVWWEPAIAAWQKKSVGNGRAILAEWRGCGNSQTFGAFDLPTLAQDCNALLNYLNLSEVDLVAHSTGGLIGLHALAAAPENYHRAMLLDPVAPEGVQFGPEMISAFARMREDRDFCAAVILGTIHRGALSESFRDRIVGAAFGVSPKIWGGVPELLRNPPPLNLDQIPHEVLVLHGEYDAVLPIEKSEALAKALPRGQFQRLLGRGHCTNVEDPRLFVELARFLS